MARSLGFKPFIPCHKEHENLSHHREQMNGQIEKKRKEKKRKMSDFDTLHLWGGRGSALIP